MASRLASATARAEDAEAGLEAAVEDGGRLRAQLDREAAARRGAEEGLRGAGDEVAAQVGGWLR